MQFFSIYCVILTFSTLSAVFHFHGREITANEFFHLAWSLQSTAELSQLTIKQPLSHENQIELQNCLEKVNFDSNTLHMLWSRWSYGFSGESELSEWEQFSDTCISISKLFISISQSNFNMTQEDIESFVNELANTSQMSKLQGLANYEAISTLQDNENFYTTIMAIFSLVFVYSVAALLAAIIGATAVLGTL